MMHVVARYKTTEIAEHYRDLALAYLEGAERLCDALVSGAWISSFHKGQVALWLAFHASELFIKGCICKADPARLKSQHSLGELLLTFSDLYPALKFQPPFGPEPVPADWELMELALKSDANLHVELRYPTDKSGRQWSQDRAFSGGLFLSDLAVLRADIERISAVVYGQ